MRNFLLVFISCLLFVSDAQAAFFSQACSTGTRWVGCPAVVSGIGIANETTNAADLTITTSGSVSAANPIAVRVYTGSPPTAADFWGPGTQYITANGGAITGLASNASSQIAVSHRSSWRFATPVLGTVTTTGAASGIAVKWNPGGYQIIDLPRVQDRTLAEVEAFLAGHVACADDYPWFKGFKIRLHWREYEASKEDYSAGDAVIQRLMDALASSCGNRRVILHTDFQANHGHAGIPGNPNHGKLCIPADLVEHVVERTQEQADARTERCMAPVWNAATPVPARHLQLVEHIAERWGDHPRFEAYYPKGEGSVGGDIENNDPNYDRLNIDNHLRASLLAFRAKAPTTMACVGTNFHAGVGLDGRDNVVDNWIPWMDANPIGLCIHWPDTHTLRTIPATTTHEFHPTLWADQFGMHGEWQRPGTTFPTFSAALQACCDRSGWTSPGSSAPATWAASHPTIGFLRGGATDATGNNSAIMSQVNEYIVTDGRDSHYTDNCPAKWVAAGATCETGGI